MIKRITTFLLLMALFAPWAANAQNTLTVCDGTTTNAKIPANGLYVDTQGTTSEFIIPASTDGMSDMIGGVITKLTFYISSIPSSWGNPYIQLYMGEVDGNTISSINGPSNFTVVATSRVWSNQQSTIEVQLTTPYTYGGGNLLIGTYVTTASSTYQSTYFYGISAASSSSRYNNGSGSGTAQSFLPKTTFTYTPGSNYCASPTNVQVSNETATGATISWTGDNDSYLVVVSEGAQEPYSYDFEDGTQGWTILKGNTGDSPNNWHHNTTHVSYDGSSGELQDWATFGHNSSSGFMLSESYISATSSGGTAYGAVTPDNYLVSPQVPLGGSISFYAGAKNTSYCAEKFSVMVSTTGNTNTASFTTVQTWTLSLSSAGYTSLPYTVDLSAYAGQTGYIAIRHWDCYDQWVLCIDDITISNGDSSSGSMTYSATASPFTLNDPEHINPGTTYSVQVIGICGDQESRPSAAISFTTEVTCPAPTGLSVSDLTAHGAKVSWTKMATQETGDITYQFTWVEAGGTPNWTDAAWAYDRWNNPDQVPHAFASGLDPDTRYYFYVRRDCGDGNYSAPAIVSFTTEIACPVPTNVAVSNITGHGATVTWTGSSESESYLVNYRTSGHVEFINANFESGSLPDGWTIEGNNTWSVGTGDYYESTGTHDGNYNALITHNDYDEETYLITNAMNLSGRNDLTLSLWYINRAWTGDVDGFGIYYRINGGAWNEIFATTASHSTWTHLNETLPSGAYAANCQIGFKFTDNYGYGVGLDDITLEGLDESSEWQSISTTDNVVVLTGLASETYYEVVVQGDCGEEGISAESDPITFTTTITCPAPSNLNVTNVTGRTATINWTGSSNSYIVMIGAEHLVSNVDFETGDLSQDEFTTTASYPWTVVENTHSGAYCAKSGNGFTSTNSDLSLTMTLTNAATVSFWAKVSSEVGYDYGRFLIDDAQKMQVSGTSNDWTYYSYELSAGTHTLVWRFYKDSVDYDETGDDCFYVDNIVIKGGVTSWTEYTTTETTYTFEGLTSSTSFQVKVQGDCGEEGMSAESETITFTTDVTCPAPTGLTATNITSNSAVLNWTSDAGSYNVSYFKAYFFDSFEEDLSQWTIYKEGDDESWEWGIENPHDNSSDLSAHSGDFAVVAYSDEEVHADSWLVSPQILFPNQTTLKFWIMRSTYDEAKDEYEVLLSTTGNAISDFTTVLKEKEAANSTWTEVSIDLSEYDGQQGYIAIRHDYTGGFFLMVDDFGIYGWSEEITTTENSLLIEDLLPETEYLWHVQANCGDEDGMSQWSNTGRFTTLTSCPIPFDLNVTQITANGATIAWTGYNDNYEVWVGQPAIIPIHYDFEDNNISADFTNSSTSPWTVTTDDKHAGTYSVKSGGAGLANAISDLILEVTLAHDATLSFWARISSESGYDEGYFSINDSIQSNLNGISGNGSWIRYSYTLEAGTHTLHWYYTKDSSMNANDDCFYVDDITIESDVILSEMTYTATESPFILVDATNIHPETTYLVKVKGFCDDFATEYSEGIAFTTLDESTKIFVIEGDWSDGSNWVPAGVPTIEENVVLRAEATVFDVAEANIITIEDDATLTIEDGGQLKTNADVEATMKRFIIGYGTDYVETNYGYYLMALPTAAPISATDAGLITEESDYDLYSWDRTATDEEWQNNHDGIDLQNGVGYLYSNRDDMEMSFTATLRHSSEPITLTAEYDDVEHGGWNLFGNPFPCEAYITTDAEGMTFYRLVDNELVPVEGAIAPMEAFFVKATATGQTFTISREAPDESK